MLETFYLSYLIIAGTSYFTWWNWKNPGQMDKYLEVPYEIVYYKKYYQVVSSGFIHANMIHLLFNMITLFFFGPILEDYLGPINFLFIYFASLLLGSILSVTLNYKNPHYRSLGASGAVSGVVLTFAVLFPMQNLYIFLIPIGIPAFIYAIFFIFYSLYGINRKESDGIGHSAHLGGAVAGIIFGILFRFVV
ncbi:MAG: rhomboid family intramembrane serine protease [Calditrichia bacterium]|nr:rhomboid family intramembrane serine protease [Calditrichia bacterium]